MNTTHQQGGFGQGNPVDGVWQIFDQFRAGFEKRAGSRVSRGDVRAAVLALLVERPMHGYQIIREIEKRSGGAWKPSAGSVYPTLQLLADEGLIAAEEANGRKTYSLTEEGREVADESKESAPWDGAERGNRFGAAAALPKAGSELAHAVAQLARTGTPEQVDRAVGGLDDARRRVYAILAED